MKANFDFNNIYAKLYFPVIVCKNDAELTVVYMNAQAGLLFFPSYSADRAGNLGVLDQIMRFKNSAEYDSFYSTIKSMGQVDSHTCEFITYDYRIIGAAVTANTVNEAGGPYIVIYLVEKPVEYSGETVDLNNRLTNIINATLLSEDSDASVQTTLALAGKQVDVSRVYIFEEISPTMTRNTYEWCNEGVEPAIQDLQNLHKEEYPYDVIVNSGLFITDDISTLPESDRVVLEPQGIKSLAIIPFYDNERPLGYIGFDDCVKKRKWEFEEVQFLKSISAIVAVFIKRRDAERDAQHSQNVLKLISDNSDDIIYANSINDFTLKFVNKKIADVLGTTQEELLGRKCYEVFQIEKDEPCDFCPIFKLEIDEATERSDVYVWENDNIRTGKLYLAKDNIIKWVDGEYVHVETGTDITDRQEYEKRLTELASVDAMTGIYNREWGGRLLSEKLEESVEGALCYIDLDGLKVTNDNFGHDMGDEFIIGIVEHIKRHVSENHILCRWGGDEFLLWMEGSENRAERCVADIQNEMERFNASSGKPYKLSFSYGIVSFPDADRSETLDSLVTTADTKMYVNKMEKRGIHQRRRKSDPKQE